MQREKPGSHFNAALADTLAQTGKNIKPNSAIEINNDSKKVSFILKAKSAISISINNNVKQAIKNLTK